MTKPIYIGTSGWSYKHWQDNFYPKDITQKQWLKYYGGVFDTVEINTTFYHTAKESSVQNWFKQVPKDFIFSVKANRYITHLKRLKDCKDSLEYFYDSMKELKGKTGPILIQLPPSFKEDQDRLAEFISWLKPKYQHTFEFRHPSWFNNSIYNLLKKHNLALCITDLNGKLSAEEITADFTYIRLHGPKKAYTGTYGPAGIRAWKTRVEKWSKEVAVFCYFDNDDKGYAIQDAKSLKTRLNHS